MKMVTNPCFTSPLPTFEIEGIRIVVILFQNIAKKEYVA